MFQFPSNGKVYSKTVPSCFTAFRARVSIPFKRESVFKGEPEQASKRGRFNVSIPFKRESVFKEEHSQA